MKKTMYLFGMLLLAGAMIFSSCKKDEEEPAVDQTPGLNFIGGAGYTDADATMAPGSTFKVGINAAANTNSNSKIASFKVVRTFNNVATDVFEDISINESTYTWEQDLIANGLAGDERWTFTVIDKAGVAKELAIIITTNNPVVSYKNITMGSYNDPTYGSFMTAATGTVMTKAQASGDQASVDFAFYLGAVNKSTFGSPSNDDVKAVFGLEGVWTIFNETMFVLTTLSAADFDAITNSYSFPDFTGTDDINDLAANDVVQFKTTNNLNGLIKVNSINAKGDVINIDMIVED
jgi:hypothetical protein